VKFPAEFAGIVRELSDLAIGPMAGELARDREHGRNPTVPGTFRRTRIRLVPNER
jgi:hypothetical protein